MKTGIDLVHLAAFKKHIKNIPLGKIFLQSELQENKNAQSLAGIFAAKEAFFKAIGKKEDWLHVWVEKKSSGQPLMSSVLLSKNEKISVSISHDGNYAIAIVIIEKLL